MDSHEKSAMTSSEGVSFSMADSESPTKLSQLQHSVQSPPGKKQVQNRIHLVKDQVNNNLEIVSMTSYASY